MVNKILKELNRMMDAQEREIERDMETELESKVYFETAKLFAYREVEKMIKKCAQEAATSEGTDINTQEKYNTDSGKSEIRELVCDILNTILSHLEDEDGFIKEAKSDKAYPYFRVEFNGHSSGLEVDLVKDGINIFHLYKYLDGGFNLNSKEDTVNSLKIARQNLAATLKEVED